MNSHGVEISIAGCVEEMVCDPNLRPLFFHFFQLFFLFLFLFHVLCFIPHLGTKTTCSASYGKEKPPGTHRRQGKSHQPKSLWYETNRTPATQNKKSNSD